MVRVSSRLSLQLDDHGLNRRLGLGEQNHGLALAFGLATALPSLFVLLREDIL